jgi:hypothetical protein
MDQKYFDHCGKACIETFARNWPPGIDLLVYNEDMKKPPKYKQVKYLDWKVLDNEFTKFCERHHHESRVITFAKKAFSIIHAMDTLGYDRVIWLDADCASVAPVPKMLLELVSPPNVLSTHFGVVHPWPSDSDPDRTAFSCETGFLIFNKKHPMFPEMRDRYRDYYCRDITENIRRFYDGEVYGAVVAEMEQKGATMMDLNPGHRYRTPIPRSVIAPYIQHYKAGAKESRTNESIMNDIKIPQITPDED